VSGIDQSGRSSLRRSKLPTKGGSAPVEEEKRRIRDSAGPRSNEDKKIGQPVSRIEQSGRSSLRRSKLPTKGGSAHEEEEKRRIRISAGGSST